MIKLKSELEGLVAGYDVRHSRCTVRVVLLCDEHRTLNRDNPGSNPPAAVSMLGQFRSLHIASFTWHCTVEDMCGNCSGNCSMAECFP